MRPRKGNTLILVILLSSVMVLTALGLVSLSQRLAQTSYGLNQQTNCRYSAEAAIERIKFHLLQDKVTTGTWLSTHLALPQPCITTQIGTTDVNISLVSLGNDQYRADATAATPDKIQQTASFTFEHKTVETEGNPLNQFSKYVLFTNASGLWGGGTVGGYAHTNGSFTWRYSLSAQGRQTHVKACTAANNFYTQNDTGTWTSGDWSAMFPDPSVEAESQSNIGEIPTPTYTDIDADLLPIAQSMPSELYIDPSSPAYSDAFANPDYDDFRSVVEFTHDNSAKQSTAHITLYGNDSGTWRVAKQHDFAVQPGTKYLMYSTPRVDNLSGELYGQLTLVTPHIGSKNYMSTWGFYYYSNRSVMIRDNLIMVDQDGNPKFWVYDSADNPVPQDPAKSQFPGISNDSSWNVDTMSQTWDQTNYTYKKNPNYNATHDPVIGVMAQGDIMYYDGTSQKKNAIIHGAFYAADPDARTYVYWEGPHYDPLGNYNVAWMGSRVSPELPIIGYMYGSRVYGFSKGRLRMYDDDLLRTPPPYWIKIGPSVTTIEVTFGPVHFGN
jgi:hypothetical protein